MAVAATVLLSKVVNDAIPWWRVVRQGALTGPVNSFLLRCRPEAQAVRLAAEGTNLAQPLPAREEIQNWSDVHNNTPFHPLAPLVQVRVLQPIGSHRRTLAFLHGRDGTALRYAIANQAVLEDQRSKGIKVILPNAPLQWDVERLRFCWLRSGKDNPGISEFGEAVNLLIHLIRVEDSGIGPHNLCVCGRVQPRWNDGHSCCIEYGYG